MFFKKWKTGTPRANEWRGRWRAVDSEKLVSHEEWLRTHESLTNWLVRTWRVGSDTLDHLFVGDIWFEDHRTHVVELVQPSVLTMDFLRDLQRWIAECYPTWRIVVPLFLGEDKIITVYRDVLRGAPEYESDWLKALDRAREQMTDLPEFEHTKGQTNCGPG